MRFRPATVGPKVTLNGAELMKREIIITMNKFRNPSTFRRAISTVASGRVDIAPLITHSFKIEDCEEAFRTLLDRQGMKVMIVP